jgi:hypothetical protein
VRQPGLSGHLVRRNCGGFGQVAGFARTGRRLIVSRRSATSGISVTLTNTGALGGQAGGYLKFTDQGRVPCRMTGWPVVVAVTAAGAATATRHAQSTMFGAWRYAAPLPVVVLKAGDSAYAVVAASDEPAGSSTHCPAPYVRLRVSPPGDGTM